MDSLPYHNKQQHTHTRVPYQTTTTIYCEPPARLSRVRAFSGMRPKPAAFHWPIKAFFFACSHAGASQSVELLIPKCDVLAFLALLAALAQFRTASVAHNKCWKSVVRAFSTATVAAIKSFPAVLMMKLKLWTCALVVLVCVHCWPVEGKNRNRVQKWQQRTWKTRFGSAPKSEWEFDAPVRGKSHRRNLYASSRFGDGLSNVPNGYSNFHYRLDDPKYVFSNYGSSHRGHRSGKKKAVSLNENGVQKFRMKRFVIHNDAEDDDDEPEQFESDLVDAPFVFDTAAKLKDEYFEDQGFTNDLVDLDTVRSDDESIDFSPIQPGPNQKYITVQENDPFPHEAPPPSASTPGKNVSRTVEYTFIIRQGQQNCARHWRGESTLLWLGGPLLWLIWVRM